MKRGFEKSQPTKIFKTVHNHQLLRAQAGYVQSNSFNLLLQIFKRKTEIPGNIILILGVAAVKKH